MALTIHQHHLGWNPQQTPAHHCVAGDSLELELQDASGNRVKPDADASIIASLLPENANPLCGPIYIEGAEPGDLLMVDILDFQHSHWGWTALIPGFGLLPEDFPEPFLHISEYDRESIAFTADIHLPTQPFAGTLGVCPSPSESLPAIPPHCCGGNMDFKSLIAGSRLFFPVKVPGALFSMGDGHAAQGDGEVCGTAVETCLSVKLRFQVIKQRAAPTPRALMPPPAHRNTGQTLATTGIHADLQQACRDALRAMIEVLGQDYGLEPELAYCLCSCSADLRIAQLVNAPHWTVACCLPLDIFR